MRVVVVPSMVDTTAYPQPQQDAAVGVVQLLPSLLEFEPATYGVSPFLDLIQGVIPTDEVFHIKGTVVKGFGRGSKVCLAAWSICAGISVVVRLI